MDRLLINCDLGENETEAKTRKLLQLVDAANICCGVHAGGLEKTRSTIQMAHQFGVLIGAHPGLASAGGRGAEIPRVEEFDYLLNEQLETFRSLSEAVGASLAYVKLHGILYHAVEMNVELAETYLERIREIGDSVGVFALAGGFVADRCVSLGIKVWKEGFLDRGYLEDGTLVPRGQSNAMLGLEAALMRYSQLTQFGYIADHLGERLELDVDILCVHGDLPESETLLARIRDLHYLSP